MDAAQGSTVRGQDEGKEQLSARAGSDTPAPQLSGPGEMANSHTGHWVSVQGPTRHGSSQHIYRKVCVLDDAQHTLENI